MNQDYNNITNDQIEALEKQTLRAIIQALQEYSREAKQIFESTEAPSRSEVIVLAEDLVQYALEVAEMYPINKRFAGFIDYKKVRWMPTPFGLIPQVLLVDAKASTENNRDTLQQSQLPLDAEFVSNGSPVYLKAGVPTHLDIESSSATPLKAITSSVFVHFHYQEFNTEAPPFRELKSIYALSIPHQRLKERYNPSPEVSFFGQGKHSPKRNEVPRIRVYFSRLKNMCPWRLQQLQFTEDNNYSQPVWREGNSKKDERLENFLFIGR